MSRGLLDGADHGATGGKTLAKADYEALAMFRYSLRRFFYFSQEAVTKHGLTLQQHQALLAIKGFPGREEITVGELAEQMFVKHHSAVGLIDRLVDQGLVQRQNSSEDRRQVWISLTDRGERILSYLALAHREELRQLSPKLLRSLELIAREDSVLHRLADNH